MPGEINKLQIPKQNDIPVLYSLRAIAALSVCFYHFVCTTTGFFHNPYLLRVFDYGKHGVEMFFVISGFVIPWSMYKGGYAFNKFFTFLFKRLLRLEPPYITALIIAVVLFVARQKFIEHSPSIHINLTQILLHFGYMIPFFKNYTWLDPVFWTLAIEFQFYFFMAFFFVPLIKGKLLGRLAFYAATVYFTFFFSANFLPVYLSFFMLGIILFLKKSGQISPIEFYATSILMLLLCFYKFSFGPFLYAFIAFTAIAFFEKRDNKIAHSLGEVSYSIYLIHTLTGATIINVLSHNISNPIMKLILILGGLVVTLISSYIMYWLVERPSKRLSAKLRYKKTA